MRLREACEICRREEEIIQEYEDNITRYYYKRRDDEEFYERFGGMYQDFYRYVKENLSSIPFIVEFFNNIEDCDINDIAMKNPMWLLDYVSEVHRRMHCIISLYDISENHDENYIGLDIKIPKIDNITELKKFIDGLEFVLTKCPFLQDDEESLKLQAVDNGSIWLIFGVVGASVATGSVLLNNIAAFIDKCFVIKSHKNTCELQKLQIEDAKIEQKEKEELFKSIDKLYKISVKNVIKDLEASTGYQIQDGDEQGRVDQSIDKMIKMLDQGLQIHSAINSPEEVKALFAPLEMHYLSIERGLERIEAKEDTDIEQNE